MSEITFEIDWQGKKANITIDDDISWGTIDNILRKCADINDITKPKVDMAQYRSRITMACLKKAPFKWGDNASVMAIGHKVMRPIMQEVMKHYPLVMFLEDWMISFMGSIELKSLDSDSTPTVSSDSDGPKEKLTNTDSTSSNKSSPTPKKE